MKKAYLLIFDTNRPDPEIKHELEYALGNLQTRSGQGRIIKLSDEQVQKALEDQMRPPENHEPKTTG